MSTFYMKKLYIGVFRLVWNYGDILIKTHLCVSVVFYVLLYSGFLIYTKLTSVKTANL